RGELDEAVALQEKRLEVNRNLGDVNGIAAASWDLAQIDLQRENYQSAFERLVESFQLLVQLQRVDGIAIVGNTLGQLLIAAEYHEDARSVLLTSRAAAEKLGNADLVEQLTTMIDALPEPETEEQ
ncbi:hypothetical protein, partial [Pseudonocardia hydrocarbonoxydans]